jgi:hypothetical protein
MLGDATGLASSSEDFTYLTGGGDELAHGFVTFV